MTPKDINVTELQKKIVHSKSITPHAKGKLGIILFKIENKFELDNEEQTFLDDILNYLKVS